MINEDIGILKLTAIRVSSMTTYRLLPRWCIWILCTGCLGEGMMWREANVVKLAARLNIWRKL